MIKPAIQRLNDVSLCVAPNSAVLVPNAIAGMVHLSLSGSVGIVDVMLVGVRAWKVILAGADAFIYDRTFSPGLEFASVSVLLTE